MLEHQIDNRTYEKYLLNQTSFDNALPQAVAAQAKLAVKDHYTFDFLELADAHEERELEAALPANIQTQHLPAAYQHLLPNEDEIRARLQDWTEHGTT